MTVKEKAIAYDKALEIARQYWNDRAMPIGTNFKLERMFPELKESEGEKIKNFIFNELACLRATDERGTARYNELTEAIAWLEKQGQQKPVVIIPKFRVGDEIKTSNEESLTITKIDENGYWSEDLFICGFDEECIWDLVGQKHADKIEPKFKVGDWIIYKDNIWKICNISLGAYYELLKVDGEVIIRHFEGVDKTAHLWTVKDAKDGDVLTVENIIFIYKRTLANHVVSYCKLINDIFESTVDARTCCEGNTYVYPATKEQRDLLFQKMKDAGYAFDFEKKELSKIEEPVKWSEEDEGYFNSIAHALSALLVDPYFDEIKLEHFAWFNSLKNRYTWKPSDEQIKTLKCACGGNYVNLGILESLYNDLKKL